MASPLALAQDLVARLLALDVQPDPLATMTGTIIVGGQRATPVTVDVLEVRAAEASTLLRWRLRSSTAQRVDTVGSWMSRPGLLDTQGIQVLIAEAVLQPYTYPGPDGGAFDAAGDAFCACPVLPTVVGTEGVLMPAVLPPMPAGALMVDAALSGIAPAAGVPVIQPRWFVLVLLMLLTACTGGGDPGSMPRPDATHEVASGSPAPAGYAAQSVGELTFSVPGPWRAVETPPIKVPAGGADVVMQVALRAPASGGAASPVALALLTSKPSRPAAQAVKALLAIKRDVEKAQVLAVQSLSLEGFTNATLVAFVESGAAGQQRTDVLIGDLPSGAVVNLTVIASPETFEAEGLGAIALSARATGRPAEHPGAVVLRCCSAATYRSDRMNHRRAGHGLRVLACSPRCSPSGRPNTAGDTEHPATVWLVKERHRLVVLTLPTRTTSCSPDRYPSTRTLSRLAVLAVSGELPTLASRDEHILTYEVCTVRGQGLTLADPDTLPTPTHNSQNTPNDGHPSSMTSTVPQQEPSPALLAGPRSYRRGRPVADRPTAVPAARIGSGGVRARCRCSPARAPRCGCRRFGR